MIDQIHTYIFMHFPRCSGTSLKNAIFRNFDKFPYRITGKKRVRYEGKVEKNVKLLAPGHIWYGIHKICEAPCSYFGLMRNPVDRVISSYYYLLESVSNKPDWNKYITNMNLESWVDDNYGFGTDNIQVRMLNESLQFGKTESYCSVNWLGKPPKPITEKHFNNAIHNISERFCAFDILERRERFLDKLQNILKVKIENRIVNTTVGGKGTSQHIRNKIAKRDKWDMRLYEYVRDKMR